MKAVIAQLSYLLYFPRSDQTVRALISQCSALANVQLCDSEEQNDCQLNAKSLSARSTRYCQVLWSQSYVMTKPLWRTLLWWPLEQSRWLLRAFSHCMCHVNMRWVGLCLTLLAVCSVGLTTQPSSCPFKKAPTDNPNPGRGHNQPFGYHARQWLRIDTMYEHPSPEEFYEKYMRTSRPLVIRGGASQWPAIEKWRNLTYVGSNIDSHRAEINWKKMYDYDPYHPVRVRMRMDEFVKWVRVGMNHWTDF